MDNNKIDYMCECLSNIENILKYFQEFYINERENERERDKIFQDANASSAFARFLKGNKHGVD